MKLHELKAVEGSTKARKRIGHGPGSGTGKTSGKGEKGQNARSGGGVRLGDLDLKVDNYHYSEDYQKEDSTIMSLEQYIVL